jgi:hypothetical protein
MLEASRSAMPIRSRVTLFAASLFPLTLVPGVHASSEDDVLSAVRRYVAAYERQIVSIVGTEEYHQSLLGTAEHTDRRQLRSELGWVYLPHIGETIGLREIHQVDGIDRPDAGRRLHRLLETPTDERETDAHIRALLAESARYNLGADSRNFNFPTFPLTYFREKNRDRSRWKVRPLDATHARIEFRERDRPTIVRMIDSTNVPARGSCQVESASGRIESCRVVLAARQDRRSTRYEIDVVFAPDLRLGLWLPSTMHDEYTSEQPDDVPMRIAGEARYSDYRRFETGARLVR